MINLKIDIIYYQFITFFNNFKFDKIEQLEFLIDI